MAGRTLRLRNNPPTIAQLQVAGDPSLTSRYPRSGRLDALQEQLGHRDFNTTRIYLRLSDEDVKREVQKIQF